MSEVIVITSGKGGVGKTTTVANIGTGLAMLGKKVVVVDTDIGLRNLDVVLGLENRIVYNLVDVINGSCRLRQALIKDKRHPELCLLPSAQTKDKSAVSPEQMIKLTDDLREQFDYILLDCPAGIEPASGFSSGSIRSFSAIPYSLCTFRFCAMALKLPFIVVSDTTPGIRKFRYGCP